MVMMRCSNRLFFLLRYVNRSVIILIPFVYLGNMLDSTSLAIILLTAVIPGTFLISLH
jgi:hypothetical protein